MDVGRQFNSVDTYIDQLLDQLNLLEKCALLSGLDSWRTVPIPHLGIESLVMTDGPHGVRATRDNGRIFEPATSFPTGISMAASWDPDLIYQVAQALGEETRALGCDILLGPCVNIVRHPLAGRNFESYSEDPYLAGRIGVAYVNGVQSTGVSTSLKHFALNSQETERMRGSSEIDERSMREIYLAQFETIVKEAQPWTVMCSYNRVNGTYASQNHDLLTKILREEWGFQGAVMSDWGAVHTTVAAVQAGLDLEMPGPAKWFGQLLVEAVLTYQLEPAVIDRAVTRALHLLQQVGKLNGNSAPAGKVNTAEHQLLARKLAGKSITLLKNENNTLPLDPGKIKKLAVIGPMATVGSIGGGGSSFVRPPYTISPLQGLQEKLAGKVEIVYEPGCDNALVLPVLPSAMLRPSQGSGSGLYGQYFASQDLSGAPALERVDPRVDFEFLSFAPLKTTPRPFSACWTGTLTPEWSGKHSFALENTGSARLLLNGKQILENSNTSFTHLDPVPSEIVTVEMEAGQSYDLRVEYVAFEWLPFAHLRVRFAYTPSPAEDPRLDRAVALAANADAVLVFAGWPEGHESEGHDRADINLTGRQDELIRLVAAANPNCVVVLNCGSPVAMPWVDQVAAIVEAFYPGQEGGRAVAEILLGETNPSGKLPVTFPRKLQDTPAYNNFPGDRKVIYGEGLFVGYRHYDLREIEPLFPFGHGLSYTQFEYRGLSLPQSACMGEIVTVQIEIENTGSQAGKETVQLYVGDLESSLIRPPAELKAFKKVELQPGESQTIRFDLNERSFAYYHPEQHDWVVEPGLFEICLGSSSRDIRLSGVIEITE